jgi:hypothetical protein
MAPSDIGERDVTESALLTDGANVEAPGNVLLLPPSVERLLEEVAFPRQNQR